MSFAFLNVNSIRNKHESLFELVGEQIDILAIGETKLDDSFPSGQFSKKGFKNPYRLDHTANSGGIMLYVRENLIAREITLNTLPNDIQIISLELTTGTGKWAFLFVYRPPSQNLQYFLTTLADVLDYIYTKYEKVVIMGDFNCTVLNPTMVEILENFQMTSQINTPTCYKSQQGSCIDLILTNSKSFLFKCDAVETGVSDHHLMIFGFLKSKSIKIPSKEVTYRCFKTFSFKYFSRIIQQQLLYGNINLLWGV